MALQQVVENEMVCFWRYIQFTLCGLCGMLVMKMSSLDVLNLPSLNLTRQLTFSRFWISTILYLSRPSILELQDYVCIHDQYHQIHITHTQARLSLQELDMPRRAPRNKYMKLSKENTYMYETIKEAK